MTESTDGAYTSRAPMHGPAIFVLAGLSLVPLVGVPFGAICILTAAVARKSNSLLLGSIGTIGIVGTMLVYGVVLPRVFESGDFAKQFEPHAKGTMTSMVRLIEYYKLQNASYPKNFDELRASLNEGEMVFTYDPSGPTRMGEKQRDFFYEVLAGGEHYMLLGVGPDNQPFTDDDIYPLLDPVKDRAVGWVRSR